MIFLSKIKTQDRVNFAKNLSIMLRSGIGINDALTSLAEQTQIPRLKKVLYKVRDDVENGTSLADAFGAETPIFGTVFVSMIQAGERSGTVESNLQFLAEWLAKSADLQHEVNAATLYPKIVFAASVLLGGGLAVFILPKLVPLFESLGADLPAVTRLLLSLSLFIQHYWLVTIVGCVLVTALITYSNSIYAVRKTFHGWYIRMPFLGTLMRNYQLALIAQLFGTLLKSGLSINESLEVVAQSATNIHYAEALSTIQEAALKGTSVSVTMQSFPALFPKIVLNIVSVGERSGTLVQSFDYIAEFYIKEVGIQARRLPTVIEPVLLLCIAAIVGFVALAIIMPIYELTGNIS